MAVTQLDAARQVKDASVTNEKLAGSIALSKLAEAVIQADGGQAFTADQPMGGFKLTGLGTPSAGTDAATKGYVDNLTLGFSWKDSVRAATTGNVTLSGTQTIDGVALSVGQRVLVKNQTAPEENGIYVVAAGAWARATDADAWDELVSATVVVDEGTVNADTIWRSTVDAGGTLDTTAVVWDDMPGPQDILVDDTATLDLTKTGNTITGTVLDSPTLEGQDSAFHLDRANHTGANDADTLEGATLAQVRDRSTHTGDINGPLLIDEPSNAETAATLTVKANDGSAQKAIQDWVDDEGVVVSRMWNTWWWNKEFAGFGTSWALTAYDNPTDLNLRGALTFDTSGVHLTQGASLVRLFGDDLFLNAPKIGFHSATPVVQQNADTVADLWTALKAYGLLDTASDAPTIPDTEAIQDIIGAMVSGNTETNITVTYDDTNGKLDFVVTSSNRVVRETPTGAVNGTNTTFVLASAPAAGSEEVFLNGILQEPGAGNDYTISGDTITYLAAPETGDRLRVSYVPA